MSDKEEKLYHYFAVLLPGEIVPWRRVNKSTPMSLKDAQKMYEKEEGKGVMVRPMTLEEITGANWTPKD